MRHLPFISLIVMVAVAISWQLALNHSYDQGRQVAIERRTATFPVVPVPEEERTPARASETEKQLGSFSIAGKNYTVTLVKREAVVSMEIRDSDGVTQYKRTFPLSGSWNVSAKLVTRGGGTGLLVNYSAEAEPSAATPENRSWWQVFGPILGGLKPFSGPIAVEGTLLESQTDTLDFRVWAHRSSVVFPVRIDWMRGRLTPERNCVIIPCELKAIPKDPGSREDMTFARLCPNPDQCTNRERVAVNKDSKVEVLLCRVIVHWKEGSTDAPSTPATDALSDHGEISVPEGDVWVKVRIDTKEGWIHDDEDYMHLGLVFEH